MKPFGESIKDIKKMFAGEHVRVEGTIFGTKYLDPKTGREIPKRKALKILAGDY